MRKKPSDGRRQFRKRDFVLWQTLKNRLLTRAAHLTRLQRFRLSRDRKGAVAGSFSKASTQARGLSYAFTKMRRIPSRNIAVGVRRLTTKNASVSKSKKKPGWTST
jgi:hypothetical protein